MALLAKNIAALLGARQHSIFLNQLALITSIADSDRYNGSIDSDAASDSKARISSSRITLTLAALR